MKIAAIVVVRGKPQLQVSYYKDLLNWIPVNGQLRLSAVNYMLCQFQASLALPPGFYLHLKTFPAQVVWYCQTQFYFSDFKTRIFVIFCFQSSCLVSMQKV